LTIFASPRFYESTELLISASDDNYVQMEVTDAITEVVTDATTEDTNESANQLSVLSNYFNHCKKIVQSGSEKQKSFFFKKHIPHLFSNMEMPAVDDSEHLVLK
jgi:hypothetical protein